MTPTKPNRSQATKPVQNIEKDPFEGCVLAERSRRGEFFHYSYAPQKKIDFTAGHGWSPFFEKRDVEATAK